MYAEDKEFLDMFLLPETEEEGVETEESPFSFKEGAD